ncbi:hypothetical protein P171DRAFT_111572 [Karstenula rhodostoma CBS 690.94]|uniref:Ig-like domain-containing protein n=1 Tax=Karstenula rhodostoma CBS 690.94 TaxID=1392251 RepID=A0A9P4U838_9PLEO|nr:hypothetical protein P171DRAFT_111572 [Karstenula rhodostoma CBS 690.94]
MITVAIKMLSLLFTLASFIMTAMSAPSSQAPNSHHLNCTFSLRVTEACHLATTPSLSTSAALTTVLSPWGNDITNATEGVNIDAAPLSIDARSPQENIAGTLDIERPNNTKVEFRWTYGPSGGRPVTERWSEDTAGTEGRYGCAVRQDWDAPGTRCDGAHPTDERVSGGSVVMC